MRQAQIVVCKVDVDGAEATVIEALGDFLHDHRLVSLLVECDGNTRGLVERPLSAVGLEARASHARGNLRQANVIYDRKVAV
jgi:hypothetical protein